MGVMWGGAIGAPLIWNAKGSGFRLSLGWCRSGFDLFGVGETFIGNLSELVLRLSAGGRASGSAGSRNSDGNPDSPQVVVFLEMVIDVTVDY